MTNLPYRHIARTAHRIETDTTASLQQDRVAVNPLADVDALIERSHTEHLTGPELARMCDTNTRTLYAALKSAGRNRNELWAPPKLPRSAKRKTFNEWDMIQRDYEAGDAPLVLADRYGLHQQVIDRNLKSVEGLYVRNREEAVELRSKQRVEADSVRYQLRIGAMEKVAERLGVETDALRSELELEGLLLHDLD